MINAYVCIHRPSKQSWQQVIAAERQRGSTLFLTTNVVFPEPTRPSPSPRFMYSRDLDLCLSVKMSYFRGDEFSYVCGNLGVEQNAFVMRTHFIPCGLSCFCVVKRQASF